MRKSTFAITIPHCIVLDWRTLAPYLPVIIATVFLYKLLFG